MADLQGTRWEHLLLGCSPRLASGAHAIMRGACDLWLLTVECTQPCMLALDGDPVAGVEHDWPADRGRGR
jgi:hypothetical protein